jgi:hypothetical protein
MIVVGGAISAACGAEWAAAPSIVEKTLPLAPVGVIDKHSARRIDCISTMAVTGKGETAASIIMRSCIPPARAASLP